VSVEEDLRNMGGYVSNRTGNIGGQFWKRLRSTKGCNARRTRERLVEILI
jgi:hypothetical protein